LAPGSRLFSYESELNFGNRQEALRIRITYLRQNNFWSKFQDVFPAKAGIHSFRKKMDTCLRKYDRPILENGEGIDNNLLKKENKNIFT